MFTKSNYSLDVTLRAKATEVLLSDLLDTHVIWIESARQLEALVRIRNELRGGKRLKIGMWDRVRKAHTSLFGGFRKFSSSSYLECYFGSCGQCRRFVEQAHSAWKEQVPGYIYCWLVDIHARALRAQLKKIEGDTDRLRWVHALDLKSRWLQFGKGSRINSMDYAELISAYRQYELGGHVDMFPHESPERWRTEWNSERWDPSSASEELKPYLFQSGYSLELLPTHKKEKSQKLHGEEDNALTAQ